MPKSAGMTVEPIPAPGRTGMAGGRCPLHDLLAALFPREAARSQLYDKRAFIYHQGDPVKAVHYVTTGLVATERIDEDGRMTMFSVLKSGSMLAWHDLVSGNVHRGGAEALMPCETISIPGDIFSTALLREPRLLAVLMRQTIAQVGAYEDQILRLSTQDVPERLYAALMELAKGLPSDDGTVEFSVPLLKRDLAAMIGTSPEGISRGIRRLEELAIAEFSGRNTVRLRVSDDVGVQENRLGLLRRR